MVRFIKYSQMWMKKFRVRQEKGQSLVEMAIATPILLLLLIGVFEVGWAIRSYLVLVDVNRETVRYAVKGDILDFDYSDPVAIGYNNVLSHTMESLAGELPLEFVNGSPNASMIMTFLAVDTALPCAATQGSKIKVPYEFDPACDCENGDPSDPDKDGTAWFGRDDLDAHPGKYPQLVQTYGLSATTKLNDGDYQKMIDDLKAESNKLNCHLLKTNPDAELSSNMMFVTEAFYDQPQLLGMPLISNYFTDPVPLYAHTAMRLVPGRDDEDKFPGCEVYPITFPEESIWDPDNDGTQEFNAFNPPPEGTQLDVFEGGGSGGFGWLNWNPDDNDATYIEEELANPRMSVNDFTGLSYPSLANDPDNTSLNLYDWVSGSTGTVGANDVKDELVGLKGKVIIIPIYGNVSGTGANQGYYVSHFAKIRITEVCLPGSADCSAPSGQKIIKGVFVELADEQCAGTSSSPVGPAPTATPTVPPGSTATPTVPPGSTATPTVPPGSTATPTPTPTVSPTPAQEMHIQSINVTVEKTGNQYKGVVTLTVVDNTGATITVKPTVSGTWSQAVSGTVSKDTNPFGIFTDSTALVSSTGPFQFCVTNITETGWTYDASANNGTCATATYSP